MDPDAVRSVSREPHGGSTDSEVLDFSANTNPKTPPGARDVYETAFTSARSYPPEPPESFRETAAAYVGCRPAAVVPTPGGLAAIRLVTEITVAPGDTVLVPSPSFGEFAREVRLQGAEPAFIWYDRILDADPAGHALAIVCHPNNPTGDAYDHHELLAFADRCRAAGTPLLIDEAFLGFAEQPSLAGTEGVIVARSLTKLFGLPGLRAGFAVGTDSHLETLVAARQTWNTGWPALAVGSYCMRQDDFVSETRERVQAERTRMGDALADRFEVHPSDAPFLLIDVGERDVSELVAAAREQGVIVRDATTFRGLDSHIRVAVRLPAENDRLLEALADV